MAKKITAKQKREEKERLNKQKWAKQDTPVVPKSKTEEKPVAASDDKLLKTTQVKKVQTKSKAKAMGLKTVLSFDDKIAIASFVNDKKTKLPHIERVTDKSGTTIHENARMFDSSVDEQNVNIEKRMTIEEKQNDGTFKKDEIDVKATVCNPYFKTCGKDYIGIKDVAEKYFFGKTFPNENLRVQIAYNVFDIQKILGTYVNNIIYSFYNLRRDGKSDVDIIGSLYAFADFDNQLKDKPAFREAKDLLKNTEAYFSYFGDVFKKSKKGKKDENNEDYEKNLRHNFNVLRVLSFLRQICTHAYVKCTGGAKNNGDSTKVEAESLDALFNITEYFAKTAPELSKTINEIYKEGIDRINNDFVTNGKNNLYILSKVYPDMQRNELVKKYYQFVVCKEGNNVGINTRKLKESIISQHPWITTPQDNNKANDYESCRHKLYTIMCFILVAELDAHESIRDNMVAELRANMDGDDGRDAIYEKYAKDIYHIVKDKLLAMQKVFDEELVPVKVEGKNDPQQFTHGKLGKKEIESFCLSDKNTSDIAKVVYFLCNFLDGKEINELCCAMMNKFDGIGDLIDTAKQCGEEVKFIEEFACLSNCRKITNDIRVAKSISKMKNKVNIDNDIIYLDAIELLGRKIEKYQKDENGKILLGTDGKRLYTQEYKYFNDMFFNAGNHKVRNFIANNVMQSKWFFYVVRYNKPAECQIIMRNKTLVKFTLDDLPDMQIQRYYSSVFGDNNMPAVDEMRKRLLDKINQFSVRGFLDELDEIVLMSDEESKRNKSSEKEQKKSLIRLYLTIAYLITKSMVKINTRFSIACAMYERDYALLCQSEMKGGPWDGGAQALAVTRKFLNHDREVFDRYCAREAEIARLPSEERKPLRKANDKLLKQTHYTNHSYTYIVNNLNSFTDIDYCAKDVGLPAPNDKNDNASILGEMRNDIAHLNIVHDMVKYIEELKDISSYYAFYCYVLQRRLVGKDPNCQNKFKAKYAKELNDYGTYNKNLMWMLNLPFAYNLPRYKNLSSEFLFYDMEYNKKDDE